MVKNMPYYSPDISHLKCRSQRFVRRMFFMRQLGTTLCFFPISSVFIDSGRETLFHCFLFLNAFFWPWLAYHRAINAVDSIYTERENLTLDAAFGGIWVGLMAISPFPSLIIMAVLASDRYAAGGTPQLISSARAFLVALILVWMVEGFKINLTFSSRTALLSIPLASCYAMALSFTSYNLTWHLRKRNRELERLALMDPGLELPNRRMFERRLESAFLSTHRGDSSGYLLLIDVDYFKSVNDTWGHDVGDFLLTEVSKVLRSRVRSQGIPARLGGDELGIILHHATQITVMDLAKKLQAQIASIKLPVSPEFRCTVSIGIASASEAESVNQWLSQADDALYEVKRSGRNSVKLWVSSRDC